MKNLIAFMLVCLVVFAIWGIETALEHYAFDRVEKIFIVGVLVSLVALFVILIFQFGRFA